MYLIRFMCGVYARATDLNQGPAAAPRHRCHAYCANASFDDRHVRSSSIIYQRRNEMILVFVIFIFTLLGVISLYFFYTLDFSNVSSLYAIIYVRVLTTNCSSQI